MDPRFSAWCPACNWNLDPSGGDGPRKGTARARDRQERLLERAPAAGPGDAPGNAALYGALALATAVNLLTIALLGSGVWLLATGTVPEKVLGAVALLLAVAARPRPGRMPEHTVDRAAAPTLYTVAERTAAGLGTRPVDFIAVDSRYGSGRLTVGLRRRRVLVLGLPLWDVLTADQRLALLANGLAHASGGGRRSARWIQAALDALTVWADVVRPDPDRQDRVDAHTLDGTALSGSRRSSAGLATLGAALARPLQDLLAHGARLLHQSLSRLSGQAGGKAEYRADEAAARVASTRSVLGLLRTLLLRDTATFALARFAREDGGSGDMGEALRTHLASVPELERERRLRLSEVRGASGDGCPPISLRIRFAEKLLHAEPAVTVTDAEARAIERELLPLRTSIAEELRDRARETGGA
ncbi:M48 family metallopeptidase [Streptomyces sp. NPDC096198]|uniref:M48 family metallopeptidase n=1 Tax=Streptomyces sp. NPDC096198 TaxID=3366080 RepID=UPI00381D6588